MKIDSQISRRRAFRLMAALATTISANPADRPKRNMLIRSVRPEDFEMPLSGFDSWITPTEHFFVRTHVSRPTVNLNSWRLSVTGEVSTPLNLTLSDLKKFRDAEVVSVLECAGKGRSFYRPVVAGMQWTHGAVGNARWRGVRLADVLKKAGIKSSAQHILLNGADTPPGTMPDFVRTVPVHKALDPDTILAFQMNGEDLPAAHGFPLRLVAPGWAGDSWAKWVTNIEVLDKEHDGFFMKTAYRYPVRPVAPGEAVAPADMKSVESIRIKSVIAGPVDGATAGPGPLRIHGTAWGGESPVARVDVSTDGGQTWSEATLGKDRARYAWRLWETRWTPPGPGSYTLMARATDSAGTAQPMAGDWNPSGYLWNAVQRVQITVGPQAVRPTSMQSEIPAFPQKVRQACIGCHESDIIAGQHLTQAQWDREITKMTGWGATVNPADRSEILDFLLKSFGPRP